MIALTRAICKNVATSAAYQRHLKGSANQNGRLYVGQITDAMACSFKGYDSAVIARNLSKRPGLFALTGCSVSGVPRRWAEYVDQVLNKRGWPEARKTLMTLLYGSYKPDQITIQGIPTLSVFNVKVGVSKHEFINAKVPKKNYEVVFMAWAEVEMN